MSANNTQTGTPPPPSSNPPSSTPVSLPPSSAPPPPASSASQTPPSTPSPAPSSSQERSTVTAPSAPPSTVLITSVITPSPTRPGETPTPVVITITASLTNQPPGSGITGAPPPSSSTNPASLQGLEGKKDSGGLGTGGKTAIAVVVPVVVVALLVVGGILLWRRRKQKKVAEEARRKEVEEYGFNPNNDPTLPAVAMSSEMAEDQSGYRGWGNATTSSNRKASTTLNSGMTAYSDSNSNPGGHQSPGSPTQAYSDVQSNDALMNGRRETLDSEGIAALGHGPNATQQQSNIHRGPSNASSHYSVANHSDNSGEYPLPMNNPQDYYDNNHNNYYHAASPYANDPYAAGQQPIIRDVSARRNTRIENPTVYHQGNSGIAQNF